MWLYCLVLLVLLVFFRVTTPSASETEARMDYKMVVCTVCNLEMRKNQWLIDRHWENNHKDRKERGEKATTRIPSGGSKTMKDFFGVPRQDDNKKTSGEKEELEKEELELVEEEEGNFGGDFELEDTAAEKEERIENLWRQVVKLRPTSPGKEF